MRFRIQRRTGWPRPRPCAALAMVGEGPAARRGRPSKPRATNSGCRPYGPRARGSTTNGPPSGFRVLGAGSNGRWHAARAEATPPPGIPQGPEPARARTTRITSGMIRAGEAGSVRDNVPWPATPQHARAATGRRPCTALPELAHRDFQVAGGVSSAVQAPGDPPNTDHEQAAGPRRRGAGAVARRRGASEGLGFPSRPAAGPRSCVRARRRPGWKSVRSGSRLGVGASRFSGVGGVGGSGGLGFRGSGWVGAVPLDPNGFLGHAAGCRFGGGGRASAPAQANVLRTSRRFRFLSNSGLGGAKFQAFRRRALNFKAWLTGRSSCEGGGPLLGGWSAPGRRIGFQPGDIFRGLRACSFLLPCCAFLAAPSARRARLGHGQGPGEFFSAARPVHLSELPNGPSEAACAFGLGRRACALEVLHLQISGSRSTSFRHWKEKPRHPPAGRGARDTGMRPSPAERFWLRRYGLATDGWRSFSRAELWIGRRGAALLRWPHRNAEAGHGARWAIFEGRAGFSWARAPACSQPG